MQLTYHYRVKDKYAAELSRQARAVNFVWNYCNEVQQKAVRDGRKWLNYSDLARLTAGSGPLLDLHSHTLQRVCRQYDKSRRQHKLIVFLIPILGILYPLMRFLPRLYDWLMRSRVARIYGELRFLEDEIMIARGSGRDTHEMIGRLDRLERQTNNLRIPPTYASMLYMLRHHIELVRENLKRPIGG